MTDVSPNHAIRIDPWLLAVRLVRSLPFIAAVSLVTVVVTAGYVFTVSPIYTAWTRIVVDPSNRKPFENPNAPSVLGSEGLGLDTQLLIITSAAVLEPVVVRHELSSDPEFVEAKNAEASEANKAKAIEALAKAMTVRREGATYVISIGVKSQDAQKSAELSQSIAESYLREQQQFQLRASEQLAEQIDGRLVGLRERVRQAEEKVQAFRANKKLQSAVDGSLLIDQELGGLNAQLVEARGQLANATAANEEIQRYLKREIDPTALGDIVTSPRITQLLNEYSRASRNEAYLASTLLPQHPSIQQARADVARISSLVRDEIRAIGESKRVELDVAKQRVANLERQMDLLRNSSNIGEQDLIVLRELETEAKSTRAVYENVLSRAKEVANLEQITVPVARIISPAQEPEDPSWPKKKLLLALAAILGAAIAFVVVVAFEILRQMTSGRFLEALFPAKRKSPAKTSHVDALASQPDTKPSPTVATIVHKGSPKISTRLHRV